MVRVLRTKDFADWLDGLKDRAGRSRILVRIDRLAHGNPGSHRILRQGVSELKIDCGPGYRVYYLQRGKELILLPAGGDKASQVRAIEMALKWH